MWPEENLQSSALSIPTVLSNDYNYTTSNPAKPARAEPAPLRLVPNLVNFGMRGGLCRMRPPAASSFCCSHVKPCPCPALSRRRKCPAECFPE